MEYAENAQGPGTMSDYLVERLEDQEHGQEYAIEYLKADFLTAAAISLFTLRRESGLTQAQIAECLHTKQSAVARLEADFDGAISLRRYVDFVLACGFIPHQLTFTPIEVARAFTLAQPTTPLTFENQANWSSAASQQTLSVPSSATTLQEARPKLNIHDTPTTFSMSRTTTVQETKAEPCIPEIWPQIQLSQGRAA